MDIFTLKCFLTLAEYHNFTKAAFHLHVSQPSLSRIIAGMENELGVKLFHRKKYDVLLSDAGQKFSVYARRIVSEYEEAVKCTRAVDQGESGCLRIGFLPAMCMNILPEIIGRIRQEYPYIELSLEPHTQDELIRGLKDNMIDLALMIDWDVERLVGFKKGIVFLDDCYVVLHQDHVLANREQIFVEEISSEKCLFYKRMNELKVRDKAKVGILASQLEQDLKVFFENAEPVDDILGLLTLIECKAGIGILPSHLKHLCPSHVRFVRLSVKGDELKAVFRGIFCYKQSSEGKILEIVCKIIEEETNKIVFNGR